jgi:hypothetical protein
MTVCRPEHGLVGVGNKEGRNIKESGMILAKIRKPLAGAATAGVILAFGFAYAQQGPRGKSSYMPVDITEPFSAIFARLSAQKPAPARHCVPTATVQSSARTAAPSCRAAA